MAHILVVCCIASIGCVLKQALSQAYPRTSSAAFNKSQPSVCLCEGMRDLTGCPASTEAPGAGRGGGAEARGALLQLLSERGCLP